MSYSTNLGEGEQPPPEDRYDCINRPPFEDPENSIQHSGQCIFHQLVYRVDAGVNLGLSGLFPKKDDSFWDQFTLSDKHYASHFEPRGISRETCRAIGARTVSHGTWNLMGHLLNNLSAGEQGCGLIIPNIAPNGAIVGVKAKFDFPREDNDGPIKYEYPRASKPRIYLPPGTYSCLRNGSAKDGVLFICESPEKALRFWQLGYCAVGMNGINDWNKPPTKRLHPDFQGLMPHLKKYGVRVIIVPDSDYSYKKEVESAVKNQQTAWHKVGVLKGLMLPTDDEAGNKRGVDDYTDEEITGLITEFFAGPPEKPRIKDKTPLELAQGFIHAYGDKKLCFYQEAFRVYSEDLGSWPILPRGDISREVLRHLNDYYEGATSYQVRETLKHLEVLVEMSKGKSMPCLADAFGAPEGLGDEQLTECVFTRNAIVHMPTRRVFPAGSHLLNECALSVDYNPDAPEPKRFKKFLEEIFDGCQATIALWAEIAGYLLSPDTSKQKIFFLYGSSGSGKGTLIRLQEGLLGAGNVGTTSLQSLGEPFGVAPLIGKSLIVINEARLSRYSNTSESLDMMLRISGQDTISINRKGVDYVEAKLPGRIVIAANEMPVLPDASRALKRRLIILHAKGVPDKPDPHLLNKLKAERPGILNYYIEGYNRLQRNGGFTVVPVGEDEVSLVEQMAEAGNPLEAFMSSECVLGRGLEVDKARLYSSYSAWCQLHQQRAMTSARFYQALRLACSSSGVDLKERRATRDEQGKQPRFLVGIGLQIDHGAPTHMKGGLRCFGS